MPYSKFRKSGMQVPVPYNNHSESGGIEATTSSRPKMEKTGCMDAWID